MCCYTATMQDTAHAERVHELARLQGDAYSQALGEMMREAVHVEAEAGDYLVTVACEEAEGLFLPDGDHLLQWQTPAVDENQHVEVAVRDRDDHRFVPGLHVTARLIDAATGRHLGQKHLPFLWHSFLWHYGANWHLPEEGDYHIEVSIAAASFARHDELRGRRYEKPVTITLGPLHLCPGRKPFGPE